MKYVLNLLINSFVTGNTSVCGCRFEPVDNYTVVQRKYFPIFCSKSEADISSTCMMMYVVDSKSSIILNYISVVIKTNLHREFVPFI